MCTFANPPKQFAAIGKIFAVPILREFGVKPAVSAEVDDLFILKQREFLKIPCIFPAKQGNFAETGSHETASTTILFYTNRRPEY